LHGHWYGRTGVSYSDGWNTNYNNAIPSVPSDWLVFCGQNADPYKFYANGQSVGTSGGGVGNIEFGVNDPTLGSGGSDVSDFAIAAATVWSRALSEEEIQNVSSIFLEALAWNTASGALILKSGSE
jgi:hypothetical protein